MPNAISALVRYSTVSENAVASPNLLFMETKDILDHTENERRDRELRLDFTMYRDYTDTFKEEYPTPGVCVMDTYYVDQAASLMDLTGYRGPTITSFFTQHGIARLDEWMGRQIRGENNFENIPTEELEILIKRNPHLHNVVKTNLLNNLKNNEHGN